MHLSFLREDMTSDQGDSANPLLDFSKRNHFPPWALSTIHLGSKFKLGEGTERGRFKQVGAQVNKSLGDSKL